MQAEQEIATPASLARLDFVSPWQSPLRATGGHRWLTPLANAWREGMALYVRAVIARGNTGGWGW